MTRGAPLKTPLNAALAAFFASRPMARVGVAVSGGSDSMALMVALAEYAREAKIELCVATVDHGLRPEAHTEAQFVGTTAKALGLDHTILTWTNHDGRGNLLSEARNARYALLADWAKSRGLGAVAIGHTSDDVAETFMMRLARGTGLAGLAAMSDDWTQDTVRFVRPVLGQSRGALRTYLQSSGHSWVDDPTNDDPKYDRVRMRGLLSTLAEHGLTTERISEVATQLADENATLDQTARSTAVLLCQDREGDVLIDQEGASELADGILRRILNKALCYVSSSHYVPRGGAMNELLASIKEGRGHTLHGCHVFQHKGDIRITREYNAVRNLVGVSGVWDTRWLFSDTIPDTYSIRALGPDGLAQIENWRDCEVPRRTLIASPSVWRNDRLYAAPLAQFGDNFGFGPRKPNHSFVGSMITH